eukprot:8867475-Alexandrium_andersonii.AAC.1
MCAPANRRSALAPRACASVPRACECAIAARRSAWIVATLQIQCLSGGALRGLAEPLRRQTWTQHEKRLRIHPIGRFGGQL